jgi:hypothetical protein
VSEHRPIFIVGTSGSGSTLLRLMLDSHENICIPEETGFLRLAMVHEWVPYWKDGDQWYRRLGLTDAEMDAHIGTLYGGMFRAHADEQGKARWGEKTPFHVWHLELAFRMFPQATVIGLVRHPGAVVASMRRRFRRPIQSSTSHWLRATRQLVFEAERFPDHCLLLRYEDLVSQPRAVMTELLARLGEPWSESVLQHHEIDRPPESAGFTRTDRPIDTTSVTSWETYLPERTIRAIEARTGPLASVFGYAPRIGTPVAPLAPGGRLILEGSELADLKSSRGQTLDWSAPRPRPDQRPFRPPPPRRRRRSAPPSLADVTLRALIASRLQARLPTQVRRRVELARRSRPWLDRFIGSA